MMTERSPLQNGRSPRDVGGAAPFEEYRRQLAACARALAVGGVEEVSGCLADGNTTEMARLFTDGNLDKRFLKLKDQLDSVAEGFDEFDEVVAAYVKTVPLEAYDTGSRDGDRFMEWLERTVPLRAEQKDLLTCQRSRHAVEHLAARNRLPHVRFQELAASSERFLPEWGVNPELRIELNPIRVWATFHTSALLDEGDSVPATVVFFPVGSEIRTAVLEIHAQGLLRELETRGPSRLDEVAFDCLPEVREEVAQLCREFVELGLAALA